MPSVQGSQWKAHRVVRLNKDAARIELPAQLQILTESWNRVVAIPHVVYMPEKDRVLMLLSCDYAGSPFIHYAMVLFSDDGGATWSDPEYVHTDAKGNPDCGLGHALTYLGEGKLIMYSYHPPSGAWQAGSHTTSSLLLPDGSILTAYGTGYRQQEEGYEPGQYGPRDVGLVKWTIDT